MLGRGEIIGSSMRRGSFKRRLPRGSLGFRGSQALLGVAFVMVILVSSMLYLFPDLPSAPSGSLKTTPSAASEKTLHVLSASGGQSSQMPAGSSDSADQAPSSSGASPPIQEESSLLATVQIMPELTEVCLENTGSDCLHEVQVACGGRSLGIISRLVPGEKKVLALAGRQEKLLVSALDSADRRIAGRIQYIPSESWDGGAASQNSASRPVSQPRSQPASAAGGGILTVKSAPTYPLEISLSANRSEGQAGEIVGYRCAARNAGSEELSEIKIHCAGKMSSTKYLPPERS